MKQKHQLKVYPKSIDTFRFEILENNIPVSYVEKNIVDTKSFINYLQERIDFSDFWVYEFDMWENKILDRKSDYYFSYDGYHSITICFFGYFNEIQEFKEYGTMNEYTGHKEIIKYLEEEKGITIDHSSEGIEFSSNNKGKLFKYIQNVYLTHILPKHNQIKELFNN